MLVGLCETTTATAGIADTIRNQGDSEMFKIPTTALRMGCAVAFALQCATSFAGMNILTNRYDNNRSATNPTETALSPTTVTPSSFGKLWTYQVDGAIFAQPLYVQGVAVAGASGTKNVLYVATMHDVVYAFDADNPGSALWTRDFRTAGVTPGTPFDTTTASDGMGIVSTPVIDLASNKIYLVAETMEAGAYVQRLHVLDIRSGADLGATAIGGSAKGIAFDPKQHTQRPGLALADGQVWLGFGSTIPGDWTPWHGWVMTYDAATLAQTGIFVTTTGSGGGIWHSGGAPAVDSAGNVYYLTGNGTGQAYDGANNYQESLLKFTYNGGLQLLDWYTASNWQTLDSYDLDLTVSTPMLVPGTDLIAFGSKTATSTVLHTGNLGKLTANDAQVAQSIQTGALQPYAGNDGNRIIGLAYWQRGTSNSTMYVWPGQSALTAYTFNGSSFAQTKQNSATLFGEPSAALSVSANGTTVGSGILWVAHNSAAGRAVGQAAVLEAYDADNIGTTLWSSATNSARDNLGSAGRFVVPVVNNGRVYMATGSGSVQVYGILTNNVPPSNAVACASENQPCTLPAGATATVWYGANGSYFSRTGVTGSILCANSVFGDPLVGTVKACSYVITASSGAKPLSVSLTGIANGMHMIAGSRVSLTASASDPNSGGSISSVSFYDGTTLLGTATAAPYAVSWTAKTGTHTFSAAAADNLGAKGTSAIVTVTVAASDGNPPAGAVTCARENQSCVIPAGTSATVWYGAGTSWNYKTGVSGSIACNNATFGDPLYGTGKSCRRR